jgi:3-oxoacyl-[acyl-carrier protein] reductase
VKNPAAFPPLGVSIGVRSGLTGFIAVLSRQVARHNVTINGLLPGRFDTDRLRANLANASEQAGRALDDEIEAALRTIPAGRFGRSDEFGAACAFLCSSHAGYITGQNIVLDGGAFPGML